MAPTEPAYRLENLVHYYGDKKVLDITAFEIPKGSILGLLGPNGSGKSTLLKLLAFAMKPFGGRILFNGHPEAPFSPRVRSRVTLLTQKPYLLKRTVFQNVAFGLKIRKDTQDLENRVRTALGNVGLAFDGFAHRPWHELSGGEAQRVAMAARLILKPEVLLLDEPVASVDTKSAALIRQASLAARENWGTTLVIASHDLAWLFDCTDTQVSMSGGTLFETGLETVIPGPYDQPDTHAPKRTLADGQSLVLSPMDKRGGTAVIRKAHIHISLKPEKGNGFDNQILGEVRSMHLARQGQGIMTRITASGITFTLGLEPSQADALRLHPGKEVVMMFKSAHIQWR